MYTAVTFQCNTLMWLFVKHWPTWVMKTGFILHWKNRRCYQQTEWSINWPASPTCCRPIMKSTFHQPALPLPLTLISLSGCNYRPQQQRLPWQNDSQESPHSHFLVKLDLRVIRSGNVAARRCTLELSGSIRVMLGHLNMYGHVFPKQSVFNVCLTERERQKEVFMLWIVYC